MASLISRTLPLLLALPCLGPAQTFAPATIEAGRSQFQQQCAFCHGKDAAGGEDGPDLRVPSWLPKTPKATRSGRWCATGRAQTGMPKFNVSDAELASLVAFIHTQKTLAEAQNSKRRGVETADLRTGSVKRARRISTGLANARRAIRPPAIWPESPSATTA